MNIIYLSPYVPSVNAYHAGGVNVGKQIETLKKKHNVYVVAYINNDKDEKLSKEYNQDEGEFITVSTISKIARILMHPFTPAMFAIRIDKNLLNRLKDIIKDKKIDVIHLDYTAMGYYTRLKKEFPKLRLNLMEHDVVQQSFMRKKESSRGLMKLFDSWQLSCVKRIERRYCEIADVIYVTNDKDIELINQYYGITDRVYKLIPYYGVDIDDSNKLDKKDVEENSICFVGQMGRDENKQAALRLIKLFKEINLPNKKLYIIGANPDKELEKYNSENIIVTGFVEDINPYIAKCKIGVFPLMVGAGIKLKVLLAMSLGLPVVTTLVGAEGIDEEGKVLDLADSDNEFIQSMTRLLTDTNYYNDKAVQVNTFVKKEFNWKYTEEIFEKIFK